MKKFISGILVLCMLILPITSFAVGKSVRDRIVEEEVIKKELPQSVPFNIRKQSSIIGGNIISLGFDTATEIRVGNRHKDTIDASGDIKYYKVQFPQSGAVEFELDGIPEGADYDLTIYNEKKKFIAYSNRANQNMEVIKMHVEAKQWYYLVVESFYGYDSNSEYEVEVFYCLDSTVEPNESYSDAFKIWYCDIVYDTISSNHDEDWYKVSDIPRDFNYLLVLENIPKGTDYDIEIYDQYGRLIDSSTYGGNRSEKIDFKYESGGVYYIRVFSYIGSDSTKPYRLFFDY
ncbi:MAG: hypothetical protein MJA82_00365 [Clostridia bacterium]|nr:hypothetical protein [Clostridia bacterium]